MDGRSRVERIEIAERLSVCWKRERDGHSDWLILFSLVDRHGQSSSEIPHPEGSR